MWGYLIWCEDGMKGQLAEKNIGGVRFLALETGAPQHFWSRRRLRRQLEEMYHAGVRNVVRQGAVPTGLLREFGMTGVDVAPLRQALLPQMLNWAETKWQMPLKSGCVRLYAEQTDRRAWRAAEVIARRVRYMELDTGRGADVLERDLRRRYGLGSGGQPILEVCLARRPRGGCPVLLAGTGCGSGQSMQWQIPSMGEVPEELLAALLQSEKLEIETVQLKSVEFRA